MMSMPLIGVALALVLCAVVAKLIAGAPRKASKSEKAHFHIARAGPAPSSPGQPAGWPMGRLEESEDGWPRGTEIVARDFAGTSAAQISKK